MKGLRLLRTFVKLEHNIILRNLTHLETPNSRSFVVLKATRENEETIQRSELCSKPTRTIDTYFVDSIDCCSEKRETEFESDIMWTLMFYLYKISKNYPDLKEQ